MVSSGETDDKDNGEAPKPVDLRTAALVLAIEKLAKVTLERGIWP